VKSHSSLLAALGLVGLLFAFLHVPLGLFGAGLDLFWIGANLVLGVALLAAAALANLDGLRERLRSGEAKRASKYGTSAILSTVLAIAIVGMAGFLSTRYHKRLDWSEAGVHSLSDQSQKVLENLERDVEVVALFAPLDMEPVRELLERYEYASDRFQVEYADPNERPELLARFEITPESLGQGLLRIAYGDESVEVQEISEENVTNSMVKLSRTGEKTVYFLEGHNERAIAGEAGGAKEGFERAADALRNENYRVETLLLAAKGEVPPDADVVVVAGATRPLLDAERDALRRFAEGGGSLLVLVDPRANTNLVDDLRDWGVDVGDDVVVDRALALFGRATTPFAGKYDPAHPITKDLRETTLFHVVRSVRSGNDDFTEIVFTGDSAWAERNLRRFFAEGTAELDDGDDLPGPVAVAVAGRPALSKGGDDEEDESPGDSAEAGGRLVVVGDSDFPSNELLDAYRNRDLFVNSVNWLMGDVEAISIRPQRSRASRFQLTTQDFLRIRSMSLFVLPEAIAIVGVFVWWTRRRAPERS
jgi:ABC-type uncharacterized transport system involved in gliding motility auxiliary subunit